MARYRLVVFTDPVKGREAEYNNWYDNRHLGDVVSFPSFLTAQRFKCAHIVRGAVPNRYLAIYEMDAADPAGAVTDMMNRYGSADFPASEALDLDRANVAVFEVIGDVVEKQRSP